MSLASALSIALSGLNAAQQALAVTSNNVANANTDGYTRKVPSQQTLIAGGEAVGVRTLDPQRVADEYLNAELREQQAQLARSDALVGYQDRLQESLFGSPGDANQGLSNHIDRLASAAEALANTPESGALKVGFIGAAQDLVGLIKDDAAQVQTMRADADSEIRQTIDAINSQVQSLYQLNVQVARDGGASAPPDLLDRRDQLLASLAQELPISVAQQPDGTIAVYARGGQPLLEGQASRLDYTPAAQVGPDTSFGPIRLFRAGEIDPATGAPRPGATGAVLVTGGVRADLTPELAADGTSDAAQLVTSPLAGGRLQGLLDARDRLLPGVADQLGELAGLTRFALNAAHNDAVPSPPPGTLTGTRTDFSGWDPTANSGTAYLAVLDRSTGATVATVAVDATAATPADVVDQINAGLGSLGTASFDATGALQIKLNDPRQGLALDEGDSKITVTDPAGHSWGYGLAHYFGLNDLIVTGRTSTDLAVRPDIAADSSKLSAIALTVVPGPPPVAIAGGSGDNRPAQALAAALQRGIDTVARGTMAAGRATLGEYASDIVAVNAASADQAKNAQASVKAVVDDLGYRQGSVSGVNVDEELSKLVLYQQAYSVSARIVSITNQLFDELMQIGR